MNNRSEGECLSWKQCMITPKSVGQVGSNLKGGSYNLPLCKVKDPDRLVLNHVQVLCGCMS